MLNIVLYRPEIPPNTGNVARQCVGMDARLHLIGPIKFDLSDKAVKRAGLDHWADLELTVHETRDDFLKWLGDRKPWLVTKFGCMRYDKPDYKDGDVLIFGNEQLGLPDAWLKRWPDRTVYLPMPGNIRSYNLANTVCVIMAQASLKSGRFD